MYVSCFNNFNWGKDLKLTVFLVFVALIQFNSYCQGGDSLRIRPYKSHVSLALHLTQISLDATLLNERVKKSIAYKTAAATRLGLSFDYRWLGVEVFARLPIDETKAQDKGRTKTNGVFLRINKSRFWANLILQQFKGFYWGNPDEVNRLINQRAFPKRPDISNRLFQTSGYYIFSPNRFSNMGAQGENERQTRSGGSFLAGLGFAADRMRGDTALIPMSQRENFGASRQLKEVRSRLFHVSGGYAHTFVWRQKWFASIYLVPGIAYFSATETDVEGYRSSQKSEGTLRFENRISLGYNTDTYFTGLWFSSSINNQRLGAGTSYSYGFQSFRIYFGRRFQMKKQLGFLGL